jgi:hypothetical protein
MRATFINAALRSQIKLGNSSVTTRRLQPVALGREFWSDSFGLLVGRPLFLLFNAAPRKHELCALACFQFRSAVASRTKEWLATRNGL